MSVIDWQISTLLSKLRERERSNLPMRYLLTENDNVNRCTKQFI